MLTETYNCNFLFSGIINLNTFVCLSIIILVLFSVSYFRSSCGSKVGNIGYLFILLGGSINIATWAIKGCVKDYLNFFNLFHFNFPDILVTIGVVLVSTAIWKKK